MPGPVSSKNSDAVDSTGAVDMEAQNGRAGSLKKIHTGGHTRVGLTTKKTTDSAGEVVVRGTNNPDPASAVGEDLVTNSHTTDDQKDANSSDLGGYQYVVVVVASITSGTFEAGDIKLYLSGFPGPG